jgi:uncharacterized integral membrane protein (TIGR00698 family)
MSAALLQQWQHRGQALIPGLLASAVVAAAATFLSEHYGAPVMLFALLLGMAMNFLSVEGPCKAGIEFGARQVLRWGVALLGFRITMDQVTALGWQPVLLVVLSVALTIAVSMVVARLMGFQALFGLLSGGATAICGASAAMALAAAMPNHPLKERATLFTIIGVSTLSTVCMVLYPMLARLLGLDEVAAGVFIGGTIHDVAQVVGAGYSMSTKTGDVATLVKLMRVAMLLPVIVLAVVMSRKLDKDAPAGAERPPLLPWFAVAFAVLVAINSTGWVPHSVQDLGNSASRWFLVLAIAAIGMKTQLRQIAAVGIKPVLLMLGETVFLAVLVLVCWRWMN